jgi:hypothetical protein
MRTAPAWSFPTGAALSREGGHHVAKQPLTNAELLAILEPLAPVGWARAATVTGAGKPLERTVRFYAEWLAVHERPHVKQIERIVNTMRMEQ